MTRREERIQELSRLPRQVVIDRICDYPDQRTLNANVRFPVGQIAHEIRDRDYWMTNRQKDSLILQFVNHTQAKVMKKEQELEKLPVRDVINRIRAYPNQQRLNYTTAGEMRGVKIGELAERIESRNYRVSEAQYKLLYRQFAELTADEASYEQEQKISPADKKRQENAVKNSYVVYDFFINGSIDDPKTRQEINERLQSKEFTEDAVQSINAGLKPAGKPVTVKNLDVRFTRENQGTIRMEGEGNLTWQQSRIGEWLNDSFAVKTRNFLNPYLDNGIYFEQENAKKPLFWGFDYNKGGVLKEDLSLTDADLKGLEKQDVPAL